MAERVTLPIEAIAVGERDREDLGNLTSLAASLVAVGMLHPVVVTAEGTLIAGQRRLEAARTLGWEEIPVTTLTFETASEILKAELDENAERLDLSPYEASKARKRRATVLAPLAEAREKAGIRIGPSSKLDEGDHNARATRKLAAEGTGYSGTTLDKVDEVCRAADDESLPEEVREVARQQVEDLKQPKARVDRAHRAVREAKDKKSKPSKPPKPGSNIAKVIEYLTAHHDGTFEQVAIGTGLNSRSVASVLSKGVQDGLFVVTGDRTLSTGSPASVYALSGTKPLQTGPTPAETIADADKVAALRDRWKLPDPKALAAQEGLKENEVRRALALADLPAEIKGYVTAGAPPLGISVEAARGLAQARAARRNEKIEDAAMCALARKIRRGLADDTGTGARALVEEFLLWGRHTRAAFLTEADLSFDAARERNKAEAMAARERAERFKDARRAVPRDGHSYGMQLVGILVNSIAALKDVQRQPELVGPERDRLGKYITDLMIECEDALAALGFDPATAPPPTRVAAVDVVDGEIVDSTASNVVHLPRRVG